MGRSESLKYIHSVLNPGIRSSSFTRVYVISGLGGIGKTQLAITYTVGNRNIYKAILWVDIDSKVKLADFFTAFAVELGMVNQSSADQNSAKIILRDWFKTTGKFVPSYRSC